MSTQEILYTGPAVRITSFTGAGGLRLAELTFDLQGESVNKFNALTLADLRKAVTAIQADNSIQGLLITSAKDPFIVGADVTEFLSHFQRTEAELAEWLGVTQKLFSEIEDLPYPSVAAINGFCLGGGMELSLTAAYRVMSPVAKIGLPETKLGIIPGWGGTVRLPRLVGADHAIEWIASGKQWSANDALKVGAVDAVAAPDQLRGVAIAMLERAVRGELNWKAKQQEKKEPLKLNKIENGMAFESARGFVGAQAGPHYPAPLAAIDAMAKSSTLTRDAALKIEAETFGKIAKTPAAHSLVGLFLADQAVKKEAKKLAKSAPKIQSAAVLGAGIMGGGVAYQSASSGIPIVMKDIREEALTLGMSEATKLLDKQVSRGAMTPIKMGETLSRIRPTLQISELANVDIVVEAVVELEKVKRAVLAETESQIKPDAVLTSNTSTISIDRLAEGLKRPENFCGMHFFNPVHRMPLVEIIRGAKTSDRTIAATVAYATAMGKTPIVVNDCPGFLVNRVLFAYFGGFVHLMNETADFQAIDAALEKFGWPMGPAYLLDVVGIDTAHHAQEVMGAGFPDRMKYAFRSVIDLMYEAKRFGQKNGKGFYTYSVDPKGKPKKSVDPEVPTLLAQVSKSPAPTQMSAQEIVDRLMIPFIVESSRCLEDKIVSSPTDLDIAMLYGLGFPPFRGGVLRYADREGLKSICERAEKLKHLGKLYEPTAQMKALASSGTGFYAV